MSTEGLEGAATAAAPAQRRRTKKKTTRKKTSKKAVRRRAPAREPDPEEFEDELEPEPAPRPQRRWAVRKIGRGRYNLKGKLFEPGKVYFVPQDVHDHLTRIRDQYGRPRYFVSVELDENGEPVMEQGRRRGATMRRARRGPGVGSRIANARTRRGQQATERGDAGAAEGFLEPDDGGADLG